MPQIGGVTSGDSSERNRATVTPLPVRTHVRSEAVGGAIYSPPHGSDDRDSGVVIDLAEARERLAMLRGEQTELTRRDTTPAGASAPAHRRKAVSIPSSRRTSSSASAPGRADQSATRETRRSATPNSVIDEVLPDQIRAMLPVDGTPVSIGRVTHIAIGTLSATAHTLHPDSLVEAALVLSRTLCPRGKMHRRNSTLVAGFAVEYLRGVARPRPPWQFLAAEAPAEGGSVDLAWEHTITGAVLYDEIKTTEVARSRADNEWIAQCLRYAGAGAAQHGDAFLGVRLLPLGSMNTAAFITASGTILPLSPTSNDPLHGSGIEVTQ